MKKMVVMLTFLSLFLLVACTSTPLESSDKVQEHKEAQRMTVVSSGKPVDVLPAFTTFTWNDDYSRVLSAVDHKEAAQVKAYIRKALMTYLQSKGYQYQADPSKADVVIGFLFVLEDDLADMAMQQKFGLVPGSNRDRVNHPRYAKGTFLLAVLDTPLKKVYWRSALQGFVDLEKDKREANGSRMQSVLRIMLGNFPEAGR